LADAEARRIVKGGSYQHGTEMLSMGSRTDVYNVISSTRGSYLGGRLVRGVIANPVYSNGSSLQERPLVLLSSREEVQRAVNSREVKLVFADRQSLGFYFVDYTQLQPQIQHIPTAHVVNHPVLSPHGKYIAYSTQEEGSALPSEIYVHDLESGRNYWLAEGAIPRWWVSPNSADTFLVYASSAKSNRIEQEWQEEVTYIQLLSGIRADGVPQKIATGSYHGGLSQDSSFLTTGSAFLRTHSIVGQVSNTLFTSPENGREELGPAQVCNVSLSPDSLDNMAFVDFGYSAEITYSLSDNLSEVYVDSIQIQQLIINLIINAAESYPTDTKNPQVQIRTFFSNISSESLQKKHIISTDEANKIKAGSYCCIEVKDSGIGMDSQTQKKIIDPFFTTKFTGRGLGMAAVAGILRGHNGFLEIESCVGEGTTMRAFLPTVTSLHSTINTIQKPKNKLLQKALIIDDEQIILSLTKGMISRIGLHPECHNDTMQALDSFKEAPQDYSCAIVDLTMPGKINGKELIKQIKGLHQKLPIILMSGFEEKEAMAQIDFKHIDHFLAKPFRFEDVKNALQKLPTLAEHNKKS
jgi:CheY-like chemotaxis protein